MLLRATLRDKHGDDFVRTVDIASAADFDKVGRAAFSWARGRARAMGAYAPTSRVELSLQMEWIEVQPARASLPANAVRLPVAGRAVADGRGTRAPEHAVPLRRGRKKARK